MGLTWPWEEEFWEDPFRALADPFGTFVAREEGIGGAAGHILSGNSGQVDTSGITAMTPYTPGQLYTPKTPSESALVQRNGSGAPFAGMPVDSSGNLIPKTTTPTSGDAAKWLGATSLNRSAPTVSYVDQPRTPNQVTVSRAPTVSAVSVPNSVRVDQLSPVNATSVLPYQNVNAYNVGGLSPVNAAQVNALGAVNAVDVNRLAAVQAAQINPYAGETIDQTDFVARMNEYDAAQAINQQAREQQVAALGLAEQAALGNAPSAAEATLRLATDRAIKQQMAMAASAKGGAAGLAAAQRQAQFNLTDLQAEAAMNAAIIRAQEMEAARAQYLTGAQYLRGADINTAGLGLTAAQTALTPALAQAELYQQAGLQTQSLEAQAAMQATGLNSAQNMQYQQLQTEAAMQALGLTSAREMQTQDLQTQAAMQALGLTSAQNMQTQALQTQAGMQAVDVNATNYRAYQDLMAQAGMQANQLNVAQNMQYQDLLTKTGMQTQDLQTQAAMQALGLTSAQNMQYQDLATRAAMQGYDAQMAMALQNQQLQQQVNLANQNAYLQNQAQQDAYVAAMLGLMQGSEANAMQNQLASNQLAYDYQRLMAEQAYRQEQLNLQAYLGPQAVQAQLAMSQAQAQAQQSAGGLGFIGSLLSFL